MKKILLLTFCLILFNCSLLDQQSATKENVDNGSMVDIHFDVERFELANGLKVLLVKNGSLPIFSYYTFYQIGSKHEQKGTTGAAHYLEHMMFKGAKKYGAGEFDKIIEGNGGSSNAYTTKDLTVYHEAMPSQALSQIIDLEADRMGNLLLEPSAFETEREVVLNERKLRYENSPRGQLYYILQQELFTGTPYQESVIGSIEDLKAVTRDQFFAYFRKYYVPNNAVIVIVGNFDKSLAKKQIEEKYGLLAADEKVDDEQKKFHEDMFKFSFDGGKSQSYHGQSPDPMFMLAFKGLPAGAIDSYYLDILASLLADGKSSLLKQEFVQSKDPSLSYVFASNYNLQHSGAFFIGGQLLKGKGIEAFRSKLLKRIEQICQGQFSSRDLQKVRNSFLISLFSQLKTNSGIAEFIGNREVMLGDFKKYKVELDYYNNASLDDITRVCQKYLKGQDSLFISIWEKNGRKIKM